jgi:hypothetical protein
MIRAPWMNVFICLPVRDAMMINKNFNVILQSVIKNSWTGTSMARRRYSPQAWMSTPRCGHYFFLMSTPGGENPLQVVDIHARGWTSEKIMSMPWSFF